MMFSFGNAIEPPRCPLVGPGHPRHLKKKKAEGPAYPCHHVSTGNLDSEKRRRAEEKSDFLFSCS
jgi:hypothetical protein